MTNYVEFIKWCFNGVKLSDPITRMFGYVFLTVVGALIFGPSDLWPIALSGAVAIDLTCGLISWKYEDFKREQKENL